jgi:hypothetical protein
MVVNLTELLKLNLTRKTDAWRVRIITDWPQIVGTLQERARVEKVYEDTLVLGVYDSCWMQELYLLSNMIMHKVNQYLGAKYVLKIRLKYVQKQTFKHLAVVTDQVTVCEQLTAKEKRSLQKVADPELQVALQNFLIRCYHAAQLK